MPTRRFSMAALLALPLAAATVAAGRASAAPGPRVEVWKDPNCGCCGDWMRQLEGAGFQMQVYEIGNTSARKRLQMPERLASCHTARVGGYVVEGHVPAREIQRLLREKPAGVRGLAVPGMPVGSPGMDGAAYGGRKDPYDVLLVALDGSTRVYQSYR